jgi:carboxymethylenebutenolidase
MNQFEADWKSLRVDPNLSRRGVLASSLAAGFALAVMPVSAETQIKTDASGLDAGEVTIPTSNGDIPAYRAVPSSGGPFPIVLVVQEIFGVHEYIKDVCRRLAKLGYFAIAPEMFARQGDVSKLTDIPTIQKEVVSKVPDAQALADLDAAVAFAEKSGKGDALRIGVTGFCWGGRQTWLYAAHNPAVKAGVAWYGRLVGDETEMSPSHPVDQAMNLKAPVLGLYGEDDKGIPLDTVEKMRNACEKAGKICDIVVYPDAPHAFHADYRPSYREGPAEDGWKKMTEWFRTHGVI